MKLRKKAVLGGYDMDIIPTDFTTYAKDARVLLNALQSEDKMLHRVILLVMNAGATAGELEGQVAGLKRILKQEEDKAKRIATTLEL